MLQIESYEDFCRSFNDGADGASKAELLLFVQDWIIRIMDKIDEESVDYSLDTFLLDNSDKSHLRDAKKDVLSRIIDDSFEAAKRISENMRENIIRENVKMPVYKVREINSRGLNWLSRRPGSTIKEKISSSNSQMMAVQRRMSIDTGENRLYIAFLKDIIDFLQTKMDEFPEKHLRSEERECYSLFFSVVKNPDLSEIRRWENLPPNNTLLSDQYYKVIWRCWNELKQIDELIANNSNNISDRLCTIFFVEFLIKAGKYYSFPQIPVNVEYETYSVSLLSDSFRGLDSIGRIINLSKNDNKISISYLDKKIDLCFLSTTMHILIEGEQEKEIQLNAGRVYRCIELVLAKLGCKNIENIYQRELPRVQKFSSIVMDIFSIRPKYIADDGELISLNGRLLYQTQKVNADEDYHRYDVPCDKSNAVFIKNEIDNYTISTALESVSIAQMSRLMHLLEEYISAQKFTFVFPDIYNEFQLSLVHKASRLVFHKVRSFPQSVGTAFSYMKMSNFKRSFQENDFLLVINPADDDICFTLIQGIYDEKVASDIPEYKGIVWERHPSISYSIHDEISEFLDILLKSGCSECDEIYRLFGFSGIENELEKIALIFNEKCNFVMSQVLLDEIKKFKINVSDEINDFLIKHKGIINNSRVHILSLSDHIIYKGNCSFEYFSQDEALHGCTIYDELQKNTDVTLWRDHLPELAIKLLYGKFNLVDNETITPEFNVEKKIRIANTFTLSKGMNDYHFDLVQSDANRKTRYAAVVKNPAFPLSNDVECRLDMTYQYGADEPYRLLFIPIDSNAGFVEARVSWERVCEYPYETLEGPDSIPSVPWENMRVFKGWNGDVDLIAELIKKFEAIEKGYLCVNLQDFEFDVKGEKGKRRFVLLGNYKTQPINLVFVESNIEKQRNARGINFERAGLVSFEINEASRQGGQNRYVLNLSEGIPSYRGVWNSNNFGHACYRSIMINGQKEKVAFYESEFDHPEEFTPDITNVSFEVVRYKDMYKAVKIHDEDSEEAYVERKTYFAANIRRGNIPGQFLYNGWMYFLFLSVFTGKKSISDVNCPSELKETFYRCKEPWINMYHRCDDDYIKMRLFNLMSLVAFDLGEDYYSIAEKYITDYRNGEGKLPDYIGYALGDCSTDYQKSLLNNIFTLRKEKAVCILSKAVWGNEDFIWSIPVSKTLEYFEAAVKYLKKLSIEGTNVKDITMCLEFILGVFRLRKYEDFSLKYRLSLNNKLVQQLYEQLEIIISNKLPVKSFLTLEVANKGIYKDIPNILYALLMYVTGEKGAGDIRISGLDLDDLNG